MQSFLQFTILGIVAGSAYAIAASGLVLTYATSNVFNIAHGAVGMLMAYVYWDLLVVREWPTWLAFIAVIFVIAPLFGAIIERLMMRKLTEASVATSLTVTVGLMVALLGAVQILFPAQGRTVPPFFAATNWTILGVGVRAHDVITLLTGVVVAGGLYYLLKETRLGIGMRAVVDNRSLLALHGAKPTLLGQLSWAMGSSLAALAGILLVSTVGFDPLTLTFLVINAYAAALIGKLTNLPRTFIGAIILGLVINYFTLAQTYLDFIDSGLLSSLRASLPAIFLLVVMIFLPQERLRVGQVAGATLVKLPSVQRVLVSGAALIGGVVVLTMVLSTSNISRLGTSLALGMVMLSLVLLSGYGGDVSLGQMTFVGLGALVVARLPGMGATVTPWSIALAGIIAAAAGALVALPALRLRGLYLALLTLAFATMSDKLIFENDKIGFKLGGQGIVERPPGFGSEASFTILVAVAFVAMSIFVLQLRRGQYGRFLLATRDSPAACGTLGLDITRTRITVFAISAGMAGVAGAMFAGVRVAINPTDFLAFRSLPLLLVAVIGGITSVSGALIGGLFLGMSPAIQELTGSGAGSDFLFTGLAAIAIAARPNGVAGMLFGTGKGNVEPIEDPEPVDVESREEVSVLATS